MKVSLALRAWLLALAAFAPTANGAFAKEGTAKTSSPSGEMLAAASGSALPANKSEWKYVPIRRLSAMLEESLYSEIKWVVFEPNDEPLWANIRLKVGAYLMALYRQGAFQGANSTEAFFVKCDKETTTQDDINQGFVTILIGVAVLKPAEFLVIKLRQHTLPQKKPN